MKSLTKIHSLPYEQTSDFMEKDVKGGLSQRISLKF